MEPTPQKRRIDILATIMCRALIRRKTSGFNDLAEDTMTEIQTKKIHGFGGEEMIRLRCYEKLQNFVVRGMVKKEGKTYHSTPALEREFPEDLQP